MTSSATTTRRLAVGVVSATTIYLRQAAAVALRDQHPGTHAAAVVAVQEAHSQPSPRDALVRQTLTGIRRYRRSPQRRARALELGDVRKMLSARPNPGWPGGLARGATGACCCLASPAHCAAPRPPHWNSPRSSTTPGTGCTSPSAFSKTDQEGQGDVIASPFGSRPITCPACA